MSLNTPPLKLLLIGIDGAAHGVVTKMADAGQLPNFAKLRDQSAFGLLQSTFPPHTAPGWASMFTGVEPGQSGIFQFWDTKAHDYSPKNMNSSDYAREPIWHALERHGLKVGVFNVPMTHPPVPLADGYMISWPLSTTLHYTAPKSLKAELMRKGLHYHSDIVTMYRGQADYNESAAEFIADRSETTLYLQDSHPVDALFVVFTEIDRVSHHYWGREEYPSKTVEAVYSQMDDALGDMLALADENTLVIVASDHGFGLCETDFNINEYLETIGMLKTRFIPIKQEAPIEEDVSVRRWFASPDRYIREIDWSRTQLYMPTPGCFGLNFNLKGRETDGIVAVEDCDSLVKQLSEQLSQVTHDGQACFELVPASEIYSGDMVDKAPDLIVVPSSFRVMVTPNLSGELWSAPYQEGVHWPEGIICVRGSTFQPGETLHARIEDVYATILAHLGLPVATGIEGHWLKDPTSEVSREDSKLNEHGRDLTEQETRFMEEKLSKIGYF